MSILNVVRESEASPEVKPIFENLKKNLGKVPNIYAAIAHSPVTLKGILELGAALKKGQYSLKEIEAIALAISQENDCDYCLAAHTAISKGAGFSEEDIVSIRQGQPADKKIKVLTTLARDIVSTQGNPKAKLVDEFLAAGYNKAALVELIALVSYNIFTNYFNHIAGTEIDFPAAKAI